MSVTQNLTLTETKVDDTTNTSEVTIKWTSTQSGDSWNGYTRTAYYYVSINGEAETKYSVSYVLPQSTTVTIANITITVPHRNNGTGSIKVRTWMNTEISAGEVELNKSLTLTTIPRASTITKAFGGELGKQYGVTWTPLSSSFYYKLVFSLGSWRQTTDVIHPNKETPHTYTDYLPFSLANEFGKSSVSAMMSVALYTYSDRDATRQVGKESVGSLPVFLRNISEATPYLSRCTITNESGVFVQNVRGAIVTGQARSQLGARITAIYVTSGSAKRRLEYDGNSTIVDFSIEIPLTGYGNTEIKVGLEDSRGFSNTLTSVVYVIPYSPPRVVAVTGEKNVVCGRCDSKGNWDDSGTYLKIKVGRSYSFCMHNGTQLNFCGLRYRYKSASNSEYSNWIKLLDSTDMSTEEVSTAPLLDGGLSAKTSYSVQVDAFDTMGNHSYITFDIPTDTIYLHKAGSIRSLGIGEYAEESNVISIANDMKVRLKSSINGVQMYNKLVSGTNQLDIDTKYADFSGSGNERQTFFIFGEANGSIVYGVARVANNGTTLWGGTSGVTLSTKTGGILSVKLPTTAYDTFTIISGREFSV